MSIKLSVLSSVFTHYETIKGEIKTRKLQVGYNVSFKDNVYTIDFGQLVEKRPSKAQLEQDPNLPILLQLNKLAEFTISVNEDNVTLDNVRLSEYDLSQVFNCDMGELSLLELIFMATDIKSRLSFTHSYVIQAIEYLRLFGINANIGDSINLKSTDSIVSK